MNNVFAVVGEHRTQPDRLLLLGEDGCYYAYAADGQLTPVVPTDHWRLDDDTQHPALRRDDGPSPATPARPEARQSERTREREHRSERRERTRGNVVAFFRDPSLRSG